MVGSRRSDPGRLRMMEKGKSKSLNWIITPSRTELTFFLTPPAMKESMALFVSLDWGGREGGGSLEV